MASIINKPMRKDIGDNITYVLSFNIGNNHINWKNIIWDTLSISIDNNGIGFCRLALILETYTKSLFSSSEIASIG